MKAMYNPHFPEYPVRISNGSDTSFITGTSYILTIPEAERLLEELTTAIDNAKEGVQRSSS